VRKAFLSLIWSLHDQSFDPSLKFPLKAFYRVGLWVVGWGLSHLDAQDPRHSDKVPSELRDAIAVNQLTEPKAG
jgi:hypothetical protein